ncbi:MAG: sulfatase-like hydrolase/transferase [Planctomycetota bacterium]
MLIPLAFVACSKDERPSVLLVTFDTLRADHVGTYGSSKGLTPELDRLAEDGVVFEQAATVAPITLPAHTSLMTGLEPPRHGVRNNGHVFDRDRGATLAKRLAAEGYQTAAFVSAYVLSKEFGLDDGFTVYDDDFGSDLERKAEETVVRAEAWLKQRSSDRPFFLWVHLFDPHDPYEPPAAYQKPGRSPYEGEIAYADAVFRRLRRAVEAAEVSRSAPIVIATADHGEGLGEHGEDTHSFFLYDTTIRIPLILAGPGIPVGGRPQTLGRIIDIAPTVLSLLGLEAPARLDGRPVSFESDGTSQSAYIETLAPRLIMGWSEIRGLRTRDRKYIDAPAPELFDLAEDPAEVRDLASDPKLIAEWKRRLSERIGSSELSIEGGSSADVDAKLRQLGYLNAGSVRPGRGGDPKEMTDLIRTFFRVDPAVRSGDPQLMLSVAEQLLREREKDPENPVLHHCLGRLWSGCGRLEPAIAAFRSALALDASFTSCRQDLAAALGRSGALEEAERELRRVLDEEPENAEAWHDLGTTARAQGQTGEALDHYERACTLRPDKALFRLHAIQVASKLGQSERAQGHLTALEAIDPEGELFARASLTLARQARETGDAARERRLLKDLLDHQPEQPEALQAWRRATGEEAGR